MENTANLELGKFNDTTDGVKGFLEWRMRLNGSNTESHPNDSDVTKIDNEIGNLRHDIESKTTDIENINTEITNIKNDIDDNSDDIADIKSDIQDLKMNNPVTLIETHNTATTAHPEILEMIDDINSAIDILSGGSGEIEANAYYKICEIEHNLGEYPNVLILPSVGGGCGVGGLGEVPLGGTEYITDNFKIGYVNENNIKIYGGKKYKDIGECIVSKYKNKYSVIFPDYSGGLLVCINRRVGFNVV